MKKKKNWKLYELRINSFKDYDSIYNIFETVYVIVNNCAGRGNKVKQNKVVLVRTLDRHKFFYNPALKFT